MSVARLALRVGLVVALLLVAAFGWQLAGAERGCQVARRAAVGAASFARQVLEDRVSRAEAACPDAEDRLALVQGLVSQREGGVALRVARRAVREEPGRYEARLAVVLASPPGPGRDAALAGLRRLDPRLSEG